MFALSIGLGKSVARVVDPTGRGKASSPMCGSMHLCEGAPSRPTHHLVKSEWVGVLRSIRGRGRERVKPGAPAQRTLEATAGPYNRTVGYRWATESSLPYRYLFYVECPILSCLQNDIKSALRFTRRIRTSRTVIQSIYYIIVYIPLIYPVFSVVLRYCLPKKTVFMKLPIVKCTKILDSTGSQPNSPIYHSWTAMLGLIAAPNGLIAAPNAEQLTPNISRISTSV